MSGAHITITIDDADLDRELRRMMERVSDFTAFHQDVGEHMLNSLDERFQTETSPEGAKWQALAPATVSTRLRKFGNAPLTILRQSGRLAGSFSYTADTTQMEMGTSLVYAAIHHFGGQTGRGHASTIPARPYLGMSPRDEVAITEMAQDFLKN